MVVWGFTFFRQSLEALDTVGISLRDSDSILGRAGLVDIVGLVAGNRAEIGAVAEQGQGSEGQFARAAVAHLLHHWVHQDDEQLG